MANKTEKQKEGIFIIKNTISETESTTSGFFPTLPKAKEALKECCDWYSSKGTGRIYFCEFGLGGKEELVFASPAWNK